MKQETKKARFNVPVYICKLDQMKYETVLNVNNSFIHFNKEITLSKELALDSKRKLEGKCMTFQASKNALTFY